MSDPTLSSDTEYVAVRLTYSEIREFDDRIRDIQAKVSDKTALEATIIEQAKLVDSLNTALKESQDDLAATRTDLMAANGKIQEMSDRVRALTDRTGSLEAKEKGAIPTAGPTP